MPKSRFDGKEFKVADAGAFLRSRKKRLTRRTARQILRAGNDGLIGDIGMTRKALEQLAYPGSRRGRW